MNGYNTWLAPFWICLGMKQMGMKLVMRIEKEVYQGVKGEPVGSKDKNDKRSLWQVEKLVLVWAEVAVWSVRTLWDGQAPYSLYSVTLRAVSGCQPLNDSRLA